MSPGQPNGIILGYDILQKTWHPCPMTQKLMKDHSGELCRAVKCQKSEAICGHRCYSPEAKVNLLQLVSEICFAHEPLQVKSLPKPWFITVRTSTSLSRRPHGKERMRVEIRSSSWAFEPSHFSSSSKEILVGWNDKEPPEFVFDWVTWISFITIQLQVGVCLHEQDRSWFVRNILKLWLFAD